MIIIPGGNIIFITLSIFGEENMGKNYKIIVLFVFLTLICGCSNTNNSNREQNDINKPVPTIRQVEELGEVERTAYFLGQDTIFSAVIPENWYDELWLNDAFKTRLMLTCIDSEQDGYKKTNFFYLFLSDGYEGKNYKGYEKDSFRCMDGRNASRYTKEYEEEMLDGGYCYRAEIFVMPGGNYGMRGYEERDAYLTAGRYKRNQAQIEDFYNSILFQEQAECIGRKLSENLLECDRIRLYLHNLYLNIEMVVPEGIAYESGMVDYDYRVSEFRLRFYLDKEKKNYLDIFSDRTGWLKALAMEENGCEAKFLDSGELVYGYEWENGTIFGAEKSKREDCQQFQYFFAKHPAGAMLYVQRDRAELHELAWVILKSIRFK